MSAVDAQSVGVVLVGGPSTTTTFRPISMATPAPLIPVGGFPVAEPAIRALARVPGMREVLLIGFFEPDHFAPFCARLSKDLGIPVRYLLEPGSLGTAGGVHRFSQEIRGADGVKHVFVLYGDNFGEFPLDKMLDFHVEHGKLGTVLATRVPKERAGRYGVLVKNDESDEIVHYAEKPETFISDLANCGVYLFTEEVFQVLADAANEPCSDAVANARRYHIDGDLPAGFARLEQDVVQQLSGSGRLVAFEHTGVWGAIKSASVLLEANAAYLAMLADARGSVAGAGALGGATLSKPAKDQIVGHVLVDPSAKVDPTAKIGPNVYIGPGVVVGAGARVRDSILFEGVRLMENSCVLHALLGAQSVVGPWARVEGVPGVEVARLDRMRAGNVAVFGEGVRAHSEITVRGCIVLPHKNLTTSASNEILL